MFLNNNSNNDRIYDVSYLKGRYILEFSYIQITFTTFSGSSFTNHIFFLEFENSKKQINRGEGADWSSISPKTVIGQPLLFSTSDYRLR